MQITQCDYYNKTSGCCQAKPYADSAVATYYESIAKNTIDQIPVLSMLFSI